VSGAYRVLAALSLPATLPLLALHPRLRGGLRERLGWLPPHAADFRGGVWYHGSSAGDINALLPLAKLSARLHPVVITAFTRSGAEMLRERIAEPLDGRMLRLRAPLDLGPCVERFFETLRPRLLVLECLELWPALVSGAMRRGVPVAIVNGRLSARSLRGYRRFASLFAPLFAGLAQVIALSDEHAARFVEAGVPSHHLSVSSSTKHGHLTTTTVSEGASIVLGSLHRREAELLLPPLLGRLSAAERVLIAPRYPGAAAAMAKLVRRLGWRSRRLQGHRSPAVLELNAVLPGEVAILEGVGGLARAYAGAKAAFVGGSLIPRGGHNVIEPAACGVPVVTGPYVDNCRHETGLLEAAGVAVVAGDAEAAARALASSHTAAASRHRAQDVASRLAAVVEPVHARLLALVS
jgi:3-deoxy-D-manno-octulosonic-acid transferase